MVSGLAAFFVALGVGTAPVPEPIQMAEPVSVQAEDHSARRMGLEGEMMNYDESASRAHFNPFDDSTAVPMPRFGAQRSSSGQPLNEEATRLKAELQMAVKSGGMNPVRYASILKEIDGLATRGLDANTLGALRSALAQLSVGGQDAATKKEIVQQPPQESPESRVDTRPFWEFDPSKPELGWYWAREGEPPACPPEPLVLPAPVDLNLVTAILYPGQVRGDGPKDFKPHGGFTLKPEGIAVELRAPMDGYLTSVAKFTDEFGLHYGLGFVHPCGILWGGGHFGKLPPDIETAIEKIPLKGYKDSPTEQLIPPYFVKKGQVIVTGLQEKANPERPGFDWGVADYRQPNAASKDSRFRELYGSAPWNTYYGVCWLDHLPPEQESIVRSFPGGDGKQGKNSEYCK